MTRALQVALGAGCAIALVLAACLARYSLAPAINEFYLLDRWTGSVQRCEVGSVVQRETGRNVQCASVYPPAEDSVSR